MRKMAVGAMFCVMVAASTASADTEVDFAIIHVESVDRFGRSCEAPLVAPSAYVCTYRLSRESGVGSWEGDIYLAIDYVGVATNFSALDSVPGASPAIALLPDESVRIDLEAIYVRHPIFQALDAAEDWAPASAKDSEYHHVNSTNETLIGFWHWGPDWQDPSRSRTYGNWIPYDNEDEDIQYDRLGPLHQWRSTTTDDDTGAILDLFCIPSKTSCGISHDVADGYERTTPNVRFGLDAYSVEVADDPAALTGPSQGEPSPDAPPSAPVSVSSVPPHAPLALVTEAAPPSGALPRLAPPSAPAAAPAAASAPAPPPVVAVTGGAEGSERTRGGEAPPPLVASSAAALLYWLLLALYRRLAAGAALEHPLRRRILDAVREEPGIRPLPLAERLGVDHKTVAYHTDVLRRDLFLCVRRGPRQVRLYAAGAQPGSPDDEAWESIVASRAARAAVAALAAAPTGLDRAGLASAADLPVRTVDWCVNRLRRSGHLQSPSATTGGPLRLTPDALARARRLLPFDAGRADACRAPSTATHRCPSSARTRVIR